MATDGRSTQEILAAGISQLATSVASISRTLTMMNSMAVDLTDALTVLASRVEALERQERYRKSREGG